MRPVSRFIAMLSLLAAACAADVGDVNRVQPNYVKKTVFLSDSTGKEKVWYFRPTVTDVPNSAGFTFVGNQGEVQKIVWDVQEKLLVAYRAYELAKGSEEYATRPGNKYRGAPVAAFPILSHFDIQREYNPATGEQTNVIVENASDRPWYERDYMRIDWSANEIRDLTFVTGELKAQAMFYVQPTDPDSKDRPVISDDYIDITNKVFVEPETVHYEGYGDIPQCWLYSYPTKDCLGQAIKIRLSFMLAHDDSEEYEPLPHDDKAFSKFGYFATKRYVYDRERDLLEGAVEQYAERWNIWLKSRERDSDGNLVSIPIERRALRPVVYYVNDQFPRKDEGETVGLMDEAQAVNENWDVVFRDTVEKLWATGDAQGPNFGKKPARVMFLCRNNPVTDDDTNLTEEPDLSQFEVRDASGKVVATSVPFPNEKKAQNKICGPAGLNPQIGDLRFSFQYWVPNPQASAPLGYGPHAADPENGRVVQANAFIFGAGMETYASYVADTVSLMVDDLSEEDLSAGTYIRSRLQEKLGRTPDVFKSASALQSWIKEKGFDAKARELQRKARTGELKHDYVTANFEALRNGWASQFLITDEVMKAFGDGADLGQSLTDTQKQQLNPSTWAHPSAMRYYTDRVRKLSQADITAVDFFDDSIWARAEKMSYRYKDLDKQARWKAIRRDLLKDMYVASETHEVGHTLGLRHNFAASADALNYVTDGRSALPYYQEMLAPKRDSYLGKDVRPNDYWSLRPNMQVKAVAAVGEKNPLQPAYLFPFDEYMLKQYPLKELQYSSIMDYSAKPNGDLFGLGKYDFAAIRFGYGQLVDVFDPAVAGYAGHQLPSDLGSKLKSREVHYTYLPYLFAKSRKPADLQKGIDLMVKGRRTVRWAELQETRKSGGSAPVEVPYLFCSDEYADGSSVCYRFDEGADMYEMTANVQQMYENLYWFNNFKRGRVNFALAGNVHGYLSRIMSRYFSVLSNQYKHFVNDELIVRNGVTCLESFNAEEDPANYVPHYISPICGLDQFASAISSVNFFGRILATPDVGEYGWNAQSKAFEKGYSELDAQGQAPEKLNVALGEGKYAQTSYDREKYGYNFYLKPVAIGSWWDKYLAIEALGDPYTTFIGVDSGSDVLSYLINFNDLFYSEINNMVGGMAIEDFSAYAPLVDRDGKLVYRKHTALFTSEVVDYSQMRSVNPDEQYTARLLAAYLGIAFFSDEKSDTKFINSIKINVAGMGDTPEIPAEIRNDPTKYIEVLDPNTHRTYWATRYEYHDYNGNPDPKTMALGFELLKRVKDRATDPVTGNINGGLLVNELHYVDILVGMVHQWQYVRGL